MKSQPVTLKILNVLSVLLFFTALGVVFLYAPLEETMNYVQKIFYFHIANAWVGMLGFLAAAVSGVIYLVKHDQKWDIVELAAVEISVVFFLIAILAGSIWARPTWGAYWTWEPRLTTAAILEMVFVAYLLLRQGIDDPDRRARFQRGLHSHRFDQCSHHLLVHPPFSDDPSGGCGVQFFCLTRYLLHVLTNAYHHVFRPVHIFSHLC